MSKRYWVPIAAFGFLAIVIGGILFFGFRYPPVLESYPTRPLHAPEFCGYDDAKEAAEAARKTEQRKIKRLSGDALTREQRRVEYAQKAQDSARECEQRLQESADLEAQWAAATASKNAAITGLNLRWWVIAEIVTVVLALFAASVAAWAAMRANKQNAEQSRREMRAYVGVEKVQFEVTSAQLGYVPIDPSAPGILFPDFITVTMKNFGATAASNVRTKIGFAAIRPFMGRLPPGHDFDAVFRQPTAVSAIVSRSYLHSGQSEPSKTALLNAQEVWAAEQKQCSIILFGRIYYEDIFGESWSTKYCFMWEPWHPNGERFVPYEDFNGEDQEQWPS